MKEIEEIKIHSNSVAAKALKEGRWQEYEAWMAEVEADEFSWKRMDLAEVGDGEERKDDEGGGTSIRRIRRPFNPKGEFNHLNTWQKTRDDRAGDAADQWLKAHGGSGSLRSPSP